MLDKITVNTQSSIRIAVSEDLVLYCDPFKINAPIHDADVILFTHEHFDHFSPEDYQKVAKDTTLFICPASMIEKAIASGIADTAITAVNPGDIITLGNIAIQAIPAYNTKKAFHPQDKGWVGYLLTIDDQQIYIAGDTNFIPEHKELSCDIAIVPIGGYYTMDAREAAACINTMKPKTVIPTHYGSIVGHKDEGRLFKQFVRKNIDVVFKLFSE